MVKTTEQRSGASHSKTRSGDRFRSYLNHHKIVAIESLMRLLRTPMQSLLTWLVVAIAIALPGILYLAIAQLQTLGEHWQFEPQVSVFMHPRAKEEAISGLRDRLLAMPEVKTVDYITPAQAKLEFEARSGFGDVLKSLDENPLPAVLVIHTQPQYRDASVLIALQTAVRKEAAVDDVQMDLEWIQRLQAIIRIAERVVLALAGLLALGVLLVIGNTIRLAIESRRDEIVIVKLVGGANSFVRRPFLYTGFWFGLGGGLLAWLLLYIGVTWLSGPVGQLADLYQSDMRLQGLNGKESLAVIFGAAVLGLLGAALAVGRHLKNIEPT
jgi:cell division transport system permease protein